MKLLILVALFAVVYSETMSLEGDEDAWELYKKAHNKTYQSYDEEMNRRAIYVSNVRYIEKHNIEADLSRHSYWMGVNQFTDMTTAEFRAVMLGYEKSVSPSSASTFLPPLNVEIPDSVDWRKKGYVTGVKNQGSCGSCWAFSTTGSLEGQHFRKTRQLVSLSEEQLVDCDRYNSGCQGGNVGRAFAYIHQNQGIDTEECYPYTAGKQGKRGSCKFRRSCVGATVKNYMRVHGGESYLKKAVATMGPISVAICANDNFMHYRTGVFNDPQCSPTKLNHAVLVVGYGQDSRMDYWLVKNSWGTSWGMGGYVKMARNRDNQCGIASDAVFPLV